MPAIHLDRFRRKWVTIDDLKSLACSAPWFSRLGQPDFSIQPDCVCIANLDGWKNVTGLLANEPVPEIIEAGMEWLPTQPGETDPIHGQSLEQQAETLGTRKEFSIEVLAIYKATLASLRNVQGNPALKAGPNDFVEAARGAALFAFRRAAFEIVLGEPGFWCRVAKIYHAGHWPLGILPDRQIVVF
jgi:hypothetical protein